jgi:hypothetical protein
MTSGETISADDNIELIADEVARIIANAEVEQPAYEHVCNGYCDDFSNPNDQ